MEHHEKSINRHETKSPQVLSYFKQQQLHHRHLHRAGGLNQLSADLAALSLHDIDSGPVLQGPKRARPPSAKHQQTKLLQTMQLAVPPAKQAQLRSLEPPEAADPAKQDTIAPDLDRLEAAKDAQETADDAAVLRRYKIGHLIGLGNYARVYKGIFLGNNKELAIKSINLNKTSENYRQKFLPRELSILKRVNHANVCKIFEIVQVADRIFIIMQYCSRGTIADLLQRNQGPLQENMARFLFGPTVEALVYLHSLDVAHRDVKVENILLDHDYVPKLTDFSYSCWTSDSHKDPNAQTHQPQAQHQQQPQLPQKRGSRYSLSMRLNDTFCGTLPYLSPEMIRQFPYDSKKTDVWSLGVCLYVMLNDRLPFPFNDIKLMVKRQLTRDFKCRPSIEASDSCRDLLNQLLEPDFVRRITCLETSHHAWLGGSREKPNR